MISLFLAIFMLCAVIPFSSIQVFALDLPSATGFENAEPIELDETKTITITEPGTTVLLKFTAPADDEYVLAANNKGCMITMYNSNYTCIGGHYGDDAAMIKNMKAGETVYYDCGFWNEYNYGSFTVSMLIRPKATSMKIKSWYNELNRFIGSKDSLNVVFTPSYAKTEEVTWKSKNPDIVSIDKYGRYECKAEGRTTITATSESGLKCSIQINVKEYETISPEFPQSGASQRIYWDLGFGDIDFTSLFETLKTSGFEGPVILEPKYSLDIPKGILRMRTFWNRLEKEYAAKEAR